MPSDPGGRATTAIEWFPRVAEELGVLDEAGERSWRSEAAARLRAVVDEHLPLTREDGKMLSVVALELVGEEDEAALDHGLVTWRSLAADEFADLARILLSRPRRGSEKP